MPKGIKGFQKGHHDFRHSKKRFKKNCPFCSKEFEVYPSMIKQGGGRYCSKDCWTKDKKGKSPWNKGKKYPQFSGKNHYNWKGGWIIKNCQICNKLYKVEKCKEEISKYCSRECATEARKGRKLSKEHREKIGQSQKGAKSHFWKGGITPKHQKIRGSSKYKIWRDKVYRKDNWRCVICGKKCKNKDIIAHHLKSFSDYPKERFNVENGSTMCQQCHCKIHHQIKVYGKTKTKTKN